MYILLTILFISVTAFALRNDLRGAKGIFVVYIWLSTFLPYLAANLFDYQTPQYVVDITEPNADFAMLLVSIFLFAVSLFNRKTVAIGKFHEKYNMSRSDRLARNLAIYAVVSLSLYVAAIVFAAGGIAEAVTLSYLRTAVDNSLFNYALILMIIGMTLSVFAYRFKTRHTVVVYFAIGFAILCTFLAGGRAVFLLYILSLFYSDLIRASYPRFLFLSILALIGIVVLSSTMVSLRYDTQEARARLIEQDVLENSMNGLTAIDDITLAVQYVEVKGHSATAVYSPILALPIPRAVWPDKPIQFSRIFRQYRYGDNLGGLPPGLVGESYIALGIPMVAIMGIIFGYLLSALDKISNSVFQTRRPVGEAIGGVLGPTVAFALFRGGIDLGAIRIMIPVASCFVAMWFVLYQTKRRKTIVSRRTNVAGFRR